MNANDYLKYNPYMLLEKLQFANSIVALRNNWIRESCAHALSVFFSFHFISLLLFSTHRYLLFSWLFNVSTGGSDKYQQIDFQARQISFIPNGRGEKENEIKRNRIEFIEIRNKNRTQFMP